MNNLGGRSRRLSCARLCVRDSVLYIPGLADDWNGTLQLFHIEPRLRLPVFSTIGCTILSFWGPSKCRGPCHGQTGQFHYGCFVISLALIVDVLALLAPPRRLRQIGLDGVAITESRHRLWLLSLLWAGKGKGRRHLDWTWNRGQLMIQFREVFFSLIASPGHLLQRLRSFPTDTTHLSPTAQRSLSGLSSRGMLGSAVVNFSCVAWACAHSSVPPVLCIRSIMQHAARAIWPCMAITRWPAGLPC